MKGIIPKSQIKGVDICGVNNNTYIIRSDLGCYLESNNINTGSNVTIFSLHTSCQNGDHYFGDQNGYFYIIKGKSYRKVSNLSTDSNAEVASLHTKFQGGDHYLSFFNLFYIIFQRKGTFMMTSSLNEDLNATQYSLHPNCSNGLYYWGLPDRHFFLKQVSEWGVEYYEGTNLETDLKNGVFSVHPDVLNFLPGGLSITKGPAFGKWKIIKTISNDSNTTVTWHKKFIKRVGYNKANMKSTMHNWTFNLSGTTESGELISLIAKMQFSFSAEYGGSHVNTENESWNEATEVEEQLSIVLKPNDRLYLWQYNLGLGEQPVLCCRELKVNDQPCPPTEVPLPPAKP